MTVQETLRDLVTIDSVSQRSNVEIISYLASRCDAAGLRTKKLIHIDDASLEKISLVAQTSVCDSTEPDSAIELALVGHTDTVPYDPAWIEALRLTEQNGILLGRGACDTKAFIAAALTALDSIDLSTLQKPLTPVFTADRELGSLGVHRPAPARH